MDKPKSVRALGNAVSQHTRALRQSYFDYENAKTSMVCTAASNGFAAGFRAGFRFRVELENWAWGKPIPV